MQCLWFLEEEGLSYTRQAKYALALKRYHQIFNVRSRFLFPRNSACPDSIRCRSLRRSRRTSTTFTRTVSAR